MPFLRRPRLSITDDGLEFEWLEANAYHGQTETFPFAAGETTDFGSTPWWARWLVPRWGPALTEGYVVHDNLYRTRGVRGNISRRDADGIMRRVIREETARRAFEMARAPTCGLLGPVARRWRVLSFVTIRFVQRWLAWAGLRAFGWMAWRRLRALEQSKLAR